MKNRLRKELQRFGTSSEDHGFQLLSPNPIKYTDSELKEWDVLIPGPKNSIYQGEEYRIKAKFSDNYPMEAPSILFKVDQKYKPPEHKHIYSNGVICMSLLAADYSPALTLESLLVAIQSMLASASKKEKPKGDGMFVRMYGYNVDPRKLKWDFHDEEC